jgi:hypothetical protein
MFDYGAATTVRQEGMSATYRHYFQKLDELMYFKLIQKQIFESIVTFLDARDIDTSELKERQGAVLNNGVIITGGEIKAQNMAVGSAARAMAGQFLKSGGGTAQGGQPAPPPTPGST